MGSLNRREFLQRAGVGSAALLIPAATSYGYVAQANRGREKRALRELRRRLRGPVFTRSDRGYNSARQVYNPAFDKRRPVAVAQPLDSVDVQTVVRWANEYDVPLTVRSGGHSYAGYSAATSGVVVDLRRMRRVARNAGGRSVTVAAGAQLIDIYRSLARHGLLLAAGTCPSVGIGGLALGGGIGMSSRRFGLTCDQIQSLAIVTADGCFRHVSANTEADLFWANRGGGGGNFGIVTDFRFRVHRARRMAYYSLSFPWSTAAEVISVWEQFLPHADPRLGGVLTLATRADRPTISASGQYFGTEEQLTRLLSPLHRLPGARLRTGTLPSLRMHLRWAGCTDLDPQSCHTRGAAPEGKLPRMRFLAKSDYVRSSLTASGRQPLIDAIAAAQRDGLRTTSIILDAYGGEIAKIKPAATAFVHREVVFSVQYLVYYKTLNQRSLAHRWANRTHRSMHPYVSGEAYQNHIDPELSGWQQAYYGTNLERLTAIKHRYDPDFRFNFAQSLGRG